MAARYDKYDGMVGGFRAALAVAITATSGPSSANQIGVPLAVGLDSSGNLVVGEGATGVLGVYVADKAKAIGDVADVMTNGEIVDLDEAAFDPGKVYYGATTGAINVTATGCRLGFTVGDKSISDGTIASRFVVRVLAIDTTA
jgi:hypothetical protein